MNRIVKITSIILAAFAMIYLLVRGIMKVIRGEKTKYEYLFVIDNKTTDTLYIEKPVIENSMNLENIVMINNKNYLKIQPAKDLAYCIIQREEYENDDLYMQSVQDTLMLIRNNKTSKFIFNDKQKLDIYTDPKGFKIIKRVIE